MPKTHPDEKTLDKFSRGKLTRRENMKLAWHLFNCAACRGQVEKLADDGGALLATLFEGMEPLDVADNPSYDRVFSYGQSTLEVRGEARDRDRSRAPKLFTELMRHPVSRQRPLIQRTWRFKNYVFAEFLLDQSQQQVVDDPARAEDLADLALVVAEQLEGSHYGPALVNDLKARSWASIGNARRVQTNLRSAAEALEEAEKWLEQGTDDILLKARMAAYKGSLLREQQHFDQAIENFDSAYSIYKEAGEKQWMALTLISKAKLMEESGKAEAGLELLQEALELLDPKADPRLYLCAKHNYAALVGEAGQYEKAQKLLPEVRKLAQEHGTRADKVRLVWLEGWIARGLGKLDEAAKAFARAREEFIERGIGFDAALASLDLASIYAQQGRTREMKELAEEMVPIFRSRDIHREANAALLLFKQAALAERMTLKMVESMAHYLREARKNPELRYQQAS